MGPRRRGAALWLGVWMLASAAGASAGSSAGSSAPRVLIALSPSAFNDQELKAVTETLSRRRCRIWIGSTRSGAARGMAGTAVPIDVLLERVQAEQFDMLVILGGSGAKMYLWFDPNLKRLIQGMDRLHRPMGAISTATVALVHAGILDGREATGLSTPETRKLFERHRVTFRSQDVVVDRQVATGSHAAAAPAFAGYLGELLPPKSRVQKAFRNLPAPGVSPAHRRTLSLR